MDLIDRNYDAARSSAARAGISVPTCDLKRARSSMRLRKRVSPFPADEAMRYERLLVCLFYWGAL